MRTILTIICIGIIASTFAQGSFSCETNRDGVIFCDDFESTASLADRYFEYDNANGSFVVAEGVGRGGSRGMRVIWLKGQEEAGNLKKSFGKTPDDYIGKSSINPTQEYEEIYWRIDLRTQPGWQGGGGYKLSRATSMTTSNWAQGMIAHIWSSGKNNSFLAMDPASGIDESGKQKSTRYNDFPNLRWLGYKVGNIELFSNENSGKWFCVEGHVKINSIGKKDGVFEFWINDVFQAGSYDLNWHADYNSDPHTYKINAVFIENYWNNGSPILQERYLDNFVISTKRIGCDCGDLPSVKD